MDKTFIFIANINFYADLRCHVSYTSIVYRHSLIFLILNFTLSTNQLTDTSLILYNRIEQYKRIQIFSDIRNEVKEYMAQIQFPLTQSCILLEVSPLDRPSKPLKRLDPMPNLLMYRGGNLGTRFNILGRYLMILQALIGTSRPYLIITRYTIPPFFSFSTAVFASFLLLERGSMDEWPVRRHHISSFKKFPNSKSFRTGLTGSILDRHTPGFILFF